MDSLEIELKENYERNLKAVEYNEKFNRIFNQIRGNFEFILQFLHNVVESGEYSFSYYKQIYALNYLLSKNDKNNDY